MSLAKTYVAPISLPGPRPRVLPKSPGEWADHIAYLQQLSQQIQSPKWLAPSFLNSWSNYGSGYNTAGYYADVSGRVFLRGLIQGASQTLPSTLFQLPYAPQFRQVLHGLCLNGSSAYTLARIDIDTTGNVIADLLASGSIGTGWISLDGLSFSLAP